MADTAVLDGAMHRHRLSPGVHYHAVRCDGTSWIPPAMNLPPALRNAVPRRQREFLAGRHCAAQALRSLGAATEVAMAADRAPIWPQGVVGSITHSEGFAAAAVAWQTQLAGLGIDSERIADPAAAWDVAALCMVDEMRLFAAADDGGFRAFSTLVFSAKEAVFKCLYPLTRKRLPITHIAITALDRRRGLFTWQTRAVTDDRFPSGCRGSGRWMRADGYVHTAVELKPERSDEPWHLS